MRAHLARVALVVVALGGQVWLTACERPPVEIPPSVPFGHLVLSSDSPGTYEIFTMDADGSGLHQLTDDPTWASWWPRLSPDRTTIVFERTPAGVHDADHTQVAIWAMDADGSDVRLLRDVGADGWDLQGHVEWAPDGGSLTLFGGEAVNPQVWLAEPTGALRRPITDRPGTNIDPSFAPDGRSVVFIGCPSATCHPADYEVYRIPVEGGEATRLTNDRRRDHDPALSPDGTTLAWLTHFGGTTWDIRTAAADGTGPRRLLRDSATTSRPEWSRDGSLVYFHRFVIGTAGGFGIFSIRPDGTGLRALTPGREGAEEYPGT